MDFIEPNGSLANYNNKKKYLLTFQLMKNKVFEQTNTCFKLTHQFHQPDDPYSLQRNIYEKHLPMKQTIVLNQ